ncbi:MAG: hypothetical protein ACI823_002765 [Chitinophagales bacterium]|jgi:hypothetical protein
MSRLTSTLSHYLPQTCFVPMLMMVLMSVFSPLSSAEAPRWYEVEVALIGYQDNQSISHEHWPEILINDLPSDDLVSDTTLVGKEKTNPWQWINWWNNQEELSQGLYNVKGGLASSVVTIPNLRTPFAEQGIAFENTIERFSKTNELQLIWSKKWQQPIPAKEKTELAENVVRINFRTPLNFQETLHSSAPLLEAEVTGELYLYRSRYLHLVSNLNIQHWQSLNHNSAIDEFTHVLPNHSNNNDNIIPSNNSSPLTAIDEIPLRAARVKKSRRMRSNELHYIDHPLLGILVRVTPLADVTE